MATAPSFTKSGAKSTTSAKLNDAIFGIKEPNHELIKQAYVTYLANGRTSAAKTKQRGDVRGGGKKPWKQKGTGRARFGSSRNPIWRGGGIAFGPTGNENYSLKMNTASKREAIKHALTVKNDAIRVIESIECKDGKVQTITALLKKLSLTRNVLIVISEKTPLITQATNNITNVSVSQSTYLNVFDVLNADSIVIDKKALEQIEEWLGGAK